MSGVIHRALIVTTYDEKLIRSLHDFSIVESSHGGSIVTPVHRSPVNCYFTFVILPEGSGEGWEDSERAKAFRQRVVDEIRRHDDPEDGSSPFEWALVKYGWDLPEGEEVCCDKSCESRGGSYGENDRDGAGGHGVRQLRRCVRDLEGEERPLSIDG